MARPTEEMNPGGNIAFILYVEGSSPELLTRYFMFIIGFIIKSKGSDYAVRCLYFYNSISPLIQVENGT